MPIETVYEYTIISGGQLENISILENYAMGDFKNKIPVNTEVVLVFKKDITEIQATFWARGKQTIRISGIALVKKQK